MSEKRTILITGGAGFIGSHLCRKYVEQGHYIFCVDNLQTTNSTRNIDDLLLRRNFHFIRQDILKPLSLGQKVDWIFNFACAGSYTSYQFDPVHTMKTNTLGVINVLELARRNNARIMQASTSEIYGDPLEIPQRETYTGNVNMLGPRACYDEGKRSAETLFMDYYREYGTDIKIIRIFNTYGPNMDPNDGRAVTNFISKALANEDLVVYGDGSHTRSFQYIDDLLDAIDRMMRKEDFLGPVNLGNPGEVTMKDLAEQVISLAKSKSKIVFQDGATDDPKRRLPDITVAQRELNWSPKVSVDEGLRRTIDYFKKIEKPAQKILVFATTYDPDMGVPEQGLYDLAREMPETEFHVITARMRKNVPSKETKGNTIIYRVGFGTTFDKFLLPIFGARVALGLASHNTFRFMWSIMASYGALAALIFKVFHRDTLFLVSFDQSELASKGSYKLKIVLPIYKLIFRNTDSVYVSDVSVEHQLASLAGSGKFVVVPANSKSFMKQVRDTYANLLNLQQRKLARPK